jgi:hypothetical protein
VPEHAPELAISAVIGRRVELKLIDAESGDRRGKPEGVFGATIFYCVADHEPPEALDQWTLFATVTRPYVDLDIPTAIAAGSKVWLTACWINTKAQPGPISAAVSTRFSENVARAA